MKKSFVYTLLMVTLAVAALVCMAFTGFATGEVPAGLEYTITDGKVTVTGYTGTASELEIPGTIEDCPVTAVGTAAFKDNTTLTKVVIPEGVTILGEKAFMGNKNLVTVELPQGLVKIDGQAFRDCVSLKNIQIPASVVNIGGTAFYKCTSLTELYLPAGINAISNYMFQYCSGLTQMTLPDKVTNIAADSFSDCKGLTAIRIPAGVTKIGDRAFKSCSALTDVYFFGSQAQWDAITVGTDNESLQNANLHILENHSHIYSQPEIITAPDWTAEGTGKRTCSVCGDTIVVTLPVIAGSVQKWNVTLTDALQVNFHLLINENAPQEPVVRVTAGDQVVQSAVIDLEKTEEGLSLVSIDLAAAQMTEDILVELLYGDVVSTSSVYTLRQYADTVLGEENLEEYHALVKALLHYGAAAQNYFDYLTNKPADAGITGTAQREIPGNAPEDMTVTGELADGKYYGASLLYRERIAMRYYFSLNGQIDSYTFTANGKTLTPVSKDGLYYVEVARILPQRLNRQVAVTVTDGSGNTLTVSYSPLNYMVRMNKGQNTKLKTFLKAVYNYHLAAVEYVNVLPLPEVNLRYDDVLDLTAEPFYAASEYDVMIENLEITSKQVGTNQPDQAVVSYDAETGCLWAVGTGKAMLTVGEKEWLIKVEPAPISLFLIGGHSVSAGVGGDPAKSVVSQPGQVYSTYESYITEKADDSWSWEYNWSFSQTSEETLQTMGIGHGAASRPETIDALTQGHSGTYGSGSALAYEWNRLTGEKVWVINAGHGGMGLSEWRKDAMDYVHASQVFHNAQVVLKNEIAAGHYTFSRMEYFYFSCANGDQTWFTDAYEEAFLSMWNGFKTDLAMDLNGDGQAETLRTIGLVPHWRPSGQSFVYEAFNNGQSFNYYMAASGNYPDVYIASSFCRGFDRNHVSADAIAAFYTDSLLNYTLQDGTAPESLIPTTLKGYTGNAVFPDQIHVGQLTQNVQGIIMARSLYSQVSGDKATDVTLYKPYGINTVSDGETITMNTMESFRISAILPDGVQGDLGFEVVGNAVTAQGTYITAGKTAGTAQLLVKLNGKLLKTVNFLVVKPGAVRHTHCTCGGAADHSCNSDILWTAWTSTNSLPTESGYYYLTADVNMTGYANILNGNKVYLCLNGKTINKVQSTASGWVGRIYQISDFSELTVCDCTGNGVINGSSTNQNGGHIILLSNAKLNWYGGKLIRDNENTDLTSTTTNGGLIYVYDTAQVNVYGGVISGGVAKNGGSMYVAGELNIYGGTVSGGTASINGGNLYVTETGKVNQYGGSVESGTAANGGNIYLYKGSAMTLADGTVSGGKATTSFGGNIFINGNLTMTGGTVIGGNATQGGNLMLNGGSFLMEGGYVLDGTTGNEGGNLKTIGGTATITGGVMAGGKAGNGGNIAIGGGAATSIMTVHIYGGTITGGSAKLGGNVYIHNGALNVTGGSLGGEVTVNGVTYAGGTATASGGNIYIPADMLMRLTGTAVVTGGTAVENGGNILNAGNFMMTGGTVSGGSAVNGGNIYSTGDLTIKEGTVTGGTATTYGGNICLMGGVTAIRGGTVSEGQAGPHGGNIYSKNTEFTMTGGTVSGGDAVQGGNISIDTGSVFTMSGGTLTEGTATNQATTNSGWGGNLYVKGTVRLDGTAALTKGYGQANGGNVHIAGGGNFTMDGTQVVISGGTITANGKSNDLNQLKSSSDRTVQLLRGTVGATVYESENGVDTVVDPFRKDFDTFVAGYGKADVTPYDPVHLGSYQNSLERVSTGVRDRLYAMTTAMTDTEGNTLLIIVTDLSWGYVTQTQQVRQAIEAKYGIPGEYVLLGGTHNHNGPEWMGAVAETEPENIAYLQMWLEGVMESVELALADRKPAQLQIGRTETVDLAFVRRYYCADGTVTGTGPQTYYQTKLDDVNESNPLVSHETEGDEEVQLVKIARENGKDILIGQWQNHGSHDGNTTIVTNDWIGYARDQVTAELDCEFMYMQGAAGNMSTTSLLPNEKNSKTTKQIGEELAAVIIAACQDADTFTSVDSGSIKVKQVQYTDTNYRGNQQWTGEMNSVAIGKLSLVTLPVELYAESGMAIKEQTPFDMTLIMGYTNGICSYVGTRLAFQNLGYGIQDGRGTAETADAMVQIYLDGLNELFD